jgi:uncharacterized membrane protein
MKLNIKREILPMVVFIILLALTIHFYPTLPDKMPSHFNSSGAADNYSAKLPFMLILWGIIIALYLLLTFIPLLDPFWRSIKSKYGLFLLFRDFVLLFFAYIFVLTIIGGKTGNMPVQALGIGFGMLCLFMGLWLPKLPRNFFFGIRTPWTLASDEVWKKSHTVGGWIFAAGGIILIILALLKVDAGISLVAVLVPTVLISGIIYPLAIYRKLQREGHLNGPEL